jgi:cell division protein FtsB
MAVSTDDLLGLLGSKEAQLFDLARENARLRAEIVKLQKAAEAAAPAAPRLSNVIPFPGASDGQPTQ